MQTNKVVLNPICLIIAALVYLLAVSAIDLYAQVNIPNKTNNEKWNIYTHKFHHNYGGKTETVQIIKSTGHNILRHALMVLNDKCSKKFFITIHEEEKALIYQPVDESEKSKDAPRGEEGMNRQNQLDYVIEPVFWGKGDIITAMAKPFNVQREHYITMPISSFTHDKYESGIAHLACYLAGELLKNEGKKIPDCARVRKIVFEEFTNDADAKYDGVVKSFHKIIRSQLVRLLRKDEDFEVSKDKADFNIKIVGNLYSSGNALEVSVDIMDNEDDLIDSIGDSIKLPIILSDEAVDIARKLDVALHEASKE